MLSLINRLYYYIFDRLVLYPMLYLIRKKFEVYFLNLGYQPKNGEKVLSIVEKNTQENSAHKAHVYLYEKTLSLCPAYPNLEMMDILEVSCGHGGGIRWIDKAHPEVKEIRGVDLIITEKIAGEIIIGNALELPFEDSSFDLIVNVESSHLYKDVSKFFMECSRVLRPNGYLCWADLRYNSKMKTVFQEALQADFALIDYKDITSQVLKGIHLTAARYDKLLDEAPRLVQLFRNSIRTTYCAPGTESYRRLAEREKIYGVACWKNAKK